MTAPRVIIAIEPTMYAEVLAFSVRAMRPCAQVTVFDPSADLDAEAVRLRPRLIVANRVPFGAKEHLCSWVEVDAPSAGRTGPQGAWIGISGRSRAVADVRVYHVLEALDRAEEQAPERDAGPVAGAPRGVAPSGGAR